MENWYTPSQPAELPAAQRLLVLAPHPDDEIFGCGGLLARYQQQGTTIDVHILSDGAGYREAAVRQAVLAERWAESNRALAILGIPPATCAALPDRALAAQAALPVTISRQLAELQPDLLLLPSLWEIHPDHLAVARAGLAACERQLAAGRPCPQLLFYEIGSPQRANCLIDISEVWPLKQQAMQCFVSQLAQQDYLRHIAALNEYRTYTLPATVRQAEAYLRVTPLELAAILTQGGDIAGRLLGRWTEAALLAADIEAENLQSRLVEQDRRLQDQASEIARLAASERALQARLAEILNSRSWRLTAPLRRARGG